VSWDTISKALERHVEKGSTIYTDDFPTYGAVGKAGYLHESVNHSQYEWAGGEVHVNSCENRASLLKPWLAKYRGIAKTSSSLYLATFQLHRAMSKLSSIEKLEVLIKIWLVGATTFLLKSEHLLL
jgi:transposase-like protein